MTGSDVKKALTRSRHPLLRRRQLITLLSGAASWPLVARAQHSPMPVVGCLRAGSAKDSERVDSVLREGLQTEGYIEGKNVRIEYRWADGRYERVPGLAVDLVRRRVDVIVAITTSCALAAKAASATIPIIFVTGADPVKEGLVATMSRPEANLTGVTFYASVLVAKHLELIQDLVPKAAAVAVLINPSSPTAATVDDEIRSAAATTGRRIRALHAGNDRDLDAAFAAMAEIRAGALIVASDPFFDIRRENIVAAAARQGVPVVSHSRIFVDAGGLLSYSPGDTDAIRQAGIYAGRILRGARPSELPVVQPTRFELVINLKAAKIFGIRVPESLLVRADELIE